MKEKMWKSKKKGGKNYLKKNPAKKSTVDKFRIHPDLSYSSEKSFPNRTIFFYSYFFQFLKIFLNYYRIDLTR